MAEKKQTYRYTRATYAAMHASLLGWIARRRGRPITDCPYDGNSDSPYQQAMAKFWVRGWSRTVPEG